jgi:hypothetical protein
MTGSVDSLPVQQLERPRVTSSPRGKKSNIEPRHA